MKITLCMIVKNEEQYIEMCLNEALKIADDAIIVDTGSTDRTKELILKYGDKVKLLESPWKNDFAEARNKSIEQATGDWILVLDADEKILCSREKLEEILTTTEFEGFNLPIYSIVDDLQIAYSCIYCKLYKNKGYIYHGAIHENVSVPSEKVTDLSPEICKIIHYGYMKANMINRNKSKRNMDILKKQIKEKPQDPFVNYNLGNAYMLEEKYEEALKYFLKSHELTKGTLPSYKRVMLNGIAQCLYSLKDYDTCIAFLSTLMAEDAGGNPNVTAELTFMLGDCYHKKGEIKKAIACFNKCLSIGEARNNIAVVGYGSYKAQFMLARICREQGDITNAVLHYMEGLFSPYNFLKVGENEIREFLIKHNLDVILNELDTLLKG